MLTGCREVEKIIKSWLCWWMLLCGAAIARVITLNVVLSAVQFAAALSASCACAVDVYSLSEMSLLTSVWVCTNQVRSFSFILVDSVGLVNKMTATNLIAAFLLPRSSPSIFCFLIGQCQQQLLQKQNILFSFACVYQFI